MYSCIYEEIYTHVHCPIINNCQLKYFLWWCVEGTSVLTSTAWSLPAFTTNPCTINNTRFAACCVNAVCHWYAPKHRLAQLHVCVSCTGANHPPIVDKPVCPSCQQNNSCGEIATQTNLPLCRLRPKSACMSYVL